MELNLSFDKDRARESEVPELIPAGAIDVKEDVNVASYAEDDPELETFVATINQAELIALASSLRDGRPCKIGDRLEGGFNVLFHLYFDDGITWLARFPLPDYSPKRMESEIATMKYIRERTTIPIPDVYAYNFNSDNPIGVPYMLMNKLPGERLCDKWCCLNDELKRKVLGQVVKVLIELSTHRFPKLAPLS